MLYSHHQHSGTCHSVWWVFICLQHRPLPPVHLTTPWWHPSLLHRFWNIYHQKFLQCWEQGKITWGQVWTIWWMTCRSAMRRRSSVSTSWMNFIIIVVLVRSELSYLAPLGSENISAPYFKQCFIQRGIIPQIVKHHASQSQDRNNKYFILYIEFCINNNI